MYISKTTLEKKERLIILQGTTHIAPPKIYSILQKDLDWAHKNKYKIFYEGIIMGENCLSETKKTERMKKIKKFFEMLETVLCLCADASNTAYQFKKLVYPKNAINSDVNFQQVIDFLDKNDFEVELFLDIFTDVINISKDKSKKEKMGKEIKSIFTNSDNRDDSGLTPRVKRAKNNLRKTMPYLLNYRNEVAVNIIERKSKNTDSLVHYGEKHMKGMTKILKKNDWKVKEINKLDFSGFMD